ncbi:MAG: hypothetical protein IT522_09115 [Burkholderiales bacterium]|nr:hypothetical protein [Burkholderiales bacterium]
MKPLHLTFSLAVVATLVIGTAPEALAQRNEKVSCPVNGRETLQVPTGGDKDLEVGPGRCVVSTAGTYAFKNVKILGEGTLAFDDAAVEFEANSIVVQTGGTMQTGTTAGAPTPIAKNQLVIRLTGDRPQGKNPYVPLSDDACTTMTKGIGVQAGGTLSLLGAKGVVADDRRSARIGGANPGTASWTYLAEPAGPAKYQYLDAVAAKANANKIGAPVENGGQSVLYLAADVSASWKIGDWIVVATTSFSPYETEFVKIAGIDKVASARASGGLTKITLDATTPLLHYHYGSKDPGWPGRDNATAGADRNYGVDERAEVGLISRNVKLTAKVTPWNKATADENKDYAWGGELKVCAGAKKVEVEGVEIERFGKETLGSYPIHLHMLGDHAGSTLKFNSNSIHHSYNHCIAVHMTNDVTLSNNVCARAIGHLFYEEVPAGYDHMTGSVIFDTGIKYHDNLGLGAMVQSFGITPPAGSDGIFKGFWDGDYLSRLDDGYYGLYILNTDDKSLAVHGQCFARQPSGLLDGAADVVPGNPPTCPPDKLYYYEGPSGFWLVNPGTELLGNSIGGCQATGKAYWYIPPTTQNWKDPVNNNFQMANLPVGAFVNNRAHACYDGIFGEGEAGIAGDQQLQPKVGGDNNKQNIVAQFTAFTASRIRNRGVWMRPTWFVFDHARVATSREGVTLVTSGGLDGNAPGVWGLLKDSTIVGVSANNVDRWGPCAGTSNEVEAPGCVDKNADAATYVPKSYPSPAWNFAGFYIYDGPARIHDVRFVNFRADPTDPANQLLTNEDVAIQKKFTGYFNGAPVYEGDAALGWFQNNQSAYPTATDVRGLKFDNVDLRHQIFTEKVNFGNFDDGDKNTAVIDRDGSLTGFKVVTAAGSPTADDYPISLNNLPFNAAINAVDECLATGGQDRAPGFGELRATSLISPGNYGTLEFEAFMVAGNPGFVPAPPTAPNQKQAPITQWMTFSKDTTDYGAHQTMDLHSRNNQGIWEPKVASGHGYTVAVRSAAGSPGLGDAATTTPGIPNVISVGLNDIVMPHVSADNPFYVRVGVCYTGKKAGHVRPNGKFKITRGYRSWGAGPVNFAEAGIRKLFTPIDGQNSYDNEVCYNLSAQNPANLNGFSFANPAAYKGCPAHGVLGRDANASCPAGSTEALAGVTRQPICIYPKSEDYTPVASIEELTDPKTGRPVDLKKDHYYYDTDTGMLFFYVKQDRPNVVSTSPLGSCDVANPPGYCPNPKGNPYPESYYACPAEGCLTYTVRLDDADYDPAPSACVAAGKKTIYETNAAYAQPPIVGANQLAFVDGDGTRPAGAIVEALDQNATSAYPYRVSGYKGVKSDPTCTGSSFAAAGLSNSARAILGR